MILQYLALNFVCEHKLSRNLQKAYFRLSKKVERKFK